jgi:hypothetical protein
MWLPLQGPADLAWQPTAWWCRKLLRHSINGILGSSSGTGNRNRSSSSGIGNLHMLHSSRRQRAPSGHSRSSTMQLLQSGIIVHSSSSRLLVHFQEVNNSSSGSSSSSLLCIQAGQLQSLPPAPQPSANLPLRPQRARHHLHLQQQSQQQSQKHQVGSTSHAAGLLPLQPPEQQCLALITGQQQQQGGLWQAD